MSFLDNIMGGLFGSNGGKTQDYLGQIKRETQPYFQPYVNAGQQALPEWQSQMMQLTKDPAAFLNNIGSGYQQSPGFQFSVDQATKAANNAGAAGGMAGSPAVQDALAKQITGYANQDYGDWMKNALGMYTQGFGGLQNLSQMGLNAGTSFSNILSQMLTSQAEAEAARAQGQASATGGLMGGLISKFF